MKLQFKSFLLEFKHPFGVSSNIRSHTTSVFLKLESDKFIGYGEACLPAYLGETVEATSTFLSMAKIFLKDYEANLPMNFFLDEIDRLKHGHNAAKAALDIALHDLYAKIQGKTYFELRGISKSMPRKTSFTIGIDSEEKIEQKIKEAETFKILKLKVGTDDDKKLINTIRKYTDKPLYVDVNQGWKNKDEVLDMLFWMHEQKVLLVEQPMPIEMREEMTWLTERSPIPTIADESVKRLVDLEKLDGEFSGINIKLMKCCGLREAIRMIHYCKKNSLLVMLGCMAESSCATTAMAQLMQYADFVDLDAPLLYKNDPFSGINYRDGEVILNDLPGNGSAPLIDLGFLE